MKSYIFAKELLKMLIASHTTVKYLLKKNNSNVFNFYFQVA